MQVFPLLAIFFAMNAVAGPSRPQSSEMSASEFARLAESLGGPMIADWCLLLYGRSFAKPQITATPAEIGRYTDQAYFPLPVWQLRKAGRSDLKRLKKAIMDHAYRFNMPLAEVNDGYQLAIEYFFKSPDAITSEHFDTQVLGVILGLQRSMGIHGIYFQFPLGTLDQLGPGFMAHYHASYLEILRNHSTHQPLEHDVGVAMQIQEKNGAVHTHWLLDGSRLKMESGNKKIPPAIHAAPQDYIRFFEPVYRDRLGVSPDRLERAKRFSWDARFRTYYLLTTSNSFAAIDLETGEATRSVGGWVSFASQPKKVYGSQFEDLSSHLQIIDGATLVVSSGPHEELPSENDTAGFRLDRETYKGTVGDFSRWVQTKDKRSTFHPLILQSLAAAAVGLKLTQVILKVDEAHRGVMQRWLKGKEKVLWTDLSDYILAIDPRDFLTNAYKEEFGKGILD